MKPFTYKKVVVDSQNKTMLVYDNKGTQKKGMDRTNQSRLTEQKSGKKWTCQMGNSVSLWLLYGCKRHHTADVVHRQIFFFQVKKKIV